MTKIDTDMVEKLATLCKIAITEKEKEQLITNLQKIVSYIEQLDEIDTEHTEPLCYVTETLSQTPLRVDTPNNTLVTKKFLELAQKQTGGMIRVPNILK